MFRNLVDSCDETSTVASLADNDWTSPVDHEDWAAPKIAAVGKPAVREQDDRGSDGMRCGTASRPPPAACRQPLDALERSQWSDDRGSGKGGRKGGKGSDGSRDWYMRPDGRRNRPELEESVVFPEKKGKADAVDAGKYDHIPVKVRGDDDKKLEPIERFSAAGLSDSILENLQRCGYQRPTPIQKYSIPAVVGRHDVMATASTGSGKTVAFMVPCLESLLRMGPPARSGRRSPCALILSPTRELAQQIHTESTKLCFRTGIRTCTIYGGEDKFEQKKELDQGVDILVATPGRLKDMFKCKMVSLSQVRFLVLDEADTMLDQGFEPDMRYIVEQTDMVERKSDRQSMMFSATFSAAVTRIAEDFLREDYLFIKIGEFGKVSETVTQKVVLVEEHVHKVRAMEQALKRHLPRDMLAVVFVETKRAAESLETELYQKGIQVCAVHGDRSQEERDKAMTAFKLGLNPILVATDVAGRGLDIDNIALVINFDLPRHIDPYVHRCGRTGRAGRQGVAVSLVNERCRCLHDLRKQLTEAGNKANQEVPDWLHRLCNKTHNPAPQPDPTPAPKPDTTSTGPCKPGSTSTGPGKTVQPPPQYVPVTGSLTGQKDAWD